MTAIAVKAASFMRGESRVVPRLRDAAAPWMDLIAGPGPLWWRVTRFSQRNSR